MTTSVILKDSIPTTVCSGPTVPEGFVEFPADLSVEDITSLMYVDGHWVERPVVSYPDLPDGTEVDIYIKEGRVPLGTKVTPEDLGLETGVAYLLYILPPLPYNPTTIEVTP